MDEAMSDQRQPDDFVIEWDGLHATIVRLSYRETTLEWLEEESNEEWGDDYWKLTIGDRVFRLSTCGHDGSSLWVNPWPEDKDEPEDIPVLWTKKAQIHE